MKKIIMALAVALAVTVSAVAQSSSSSTPIWNHGDNVSDVSYESVPIYKILQTTDAYIVIYLARGMKVESLIIPKEWGKYGDGKKLYFRNKAAGLDSSMTVFYKGDSFDHVILTVNLNPLDPLWGIAPHGTKVDTNIDTLDIKF
ncbi:MAG: hypothetical protein J5857_08890 [Treponema sp.]|nr:hypothetical protein [Treponema sp.]